MGDGKTRTIRGEEYRPVVLKIHGRYPDGRPKEATMVHDDQSTNVTDGAEFIVVFAPTKCLLKSGN